MSSEAEKNDWHEVYGEFKRLFPEIEDQTTKGRLIRGALDDGMRKIVLVRYGEDQANRYGEDCRGDPLKGLRENPETVNELLGIIMTYRLYEKATPWVAFANFEDWFLRPEEEA